MAMQPLINCLQKIADGEVSPKYGLCFYMAELTSSVAEFCSAKNALYRCVCLWVYHSGDNQYPIAHPDNLHPHGAFHKHYKEGTLYEGEYGRRRRALAGLVAEELRKCR